MELGRVNYVLRAMNVKAGKHAVTLSFKPASLDRTETIAYVSYTILLLAVAIGVVMMYRKKKQQ